MSRVLAYIFAAIFLASLALSWRGRQPYEKRDEFPLRDAEQHGVRIQDSIVSTSDGRQIKPDDLDARPVTVVDRAGNELITLPTVPFAESARFINDDTIIFLRFDKDNRFEVLLFKRRFPEYWWGQLYRVEVWLALISGVALIGFVVRERQSREKAAA